MRIKKNILSEEQSEDALPFLELGGSRPKAVEGGCFPLQSLLYLSRNEKLSRKNKKLLYSDGRNCPEAFLDKKYIVDMVNLPMKEKKRRRIDEEC